MKTSTSTSASFASDLNQLLNVLSGFLRTRLFQHCLKLRESRSNSCSPLPEEKRYLNGEAPIVGCLFFCCHTDHASKCQAQTSPIEPPSVAFILLKRRKRCLDPNGLDFRPILSSPYLLILKGLPCNERSTLAPSIPIPQRQSATIETPTSQQLLFDSGSIGQPIDPDSGSEQYSYRCRAVGRTGIYLSGYGWSFSRSIDTEHDRMGGSAGICPQPDGDESGSGRYRNAYTESCKRRRQNGWAEGARREEAQGQDRRRGFCHGRDSCCSWCENRDCYKRQK